MNYTRCLLLVLGCSVLFACGGGGGGGKSGATNSQGGASSTAPLINPITRQSAPVVTGAFVDVFDYAASVPYQLYEELQGYSQLSDGSQTAACENVNGKIKLNRSNQGRTIEMSYENCQFNGVEINGERKIIVTSSDAVNGAKISYTYKRMRLASLSNSLEKQTWDGTVDYTGAGYGYRDSDSFFDVAVDLVIDDARDGYLEIKNFRLHQNYNQDLLMAHLNLYDYFANIQTISGELTLNNNTRFTAEAIEHGILLKGAGNSRAMLTKEDNSRLLIGWDENGDGLAEARVLMPDNFEFSISDLIAQGNHQTVTVLATNKENQIFEGAQLYMARGVSEDAYLYWNFTNKSASLLTYELNGKTTNGSEWRQVDAGHFRFTFDSNTEDTNYDLVFTATDAMGNKSPEIHAKIYVGVDTDKDGMPDVGDEDDDGDIVRDKFDAFPLDSRESKDSDGDGIGDNADPDADASVVSANVWFVDKSGVLYFTPNVRHLYPEFTSKYFSKRWDINTKTFLPELSLTNYGSSFNFYSQEMNRLFYTSAKNEIFYVDLTTMQETLFVKSGASLELVRVAFTTNNIVVVGRTNNMGTVYESYNPAGELISTMNDRVDRDSVPLYKSDLAPFCSYYITVDAEGKFYQRGSYVDARDNCGFNSFPRVSMDGHYVYKNRSVNGTPAGLYTIEGNLINAFQSGSVRWLSNGMIGVEGDIASLRSATGVPIKQFALGENASIKNVVTNGVQLVYALEFTAPTLATKIVAVDADLNFISEYQRGLH